VRKVTAWSVWIDGRVCCTLASASLASSLELEFRSTGELNATALPATLTELSALRPTPKKVNSEPPRYVDTQFGHATSAREQVGP
jgi:hypothetical protein